MSIIQLLLSLPILVMIIITLITFFIFSSKPNHKKLLPPTNYPIIGAAFSMLKNIHQPLQWVSSWLPNAPSYTHKLSFLTGPQNVVTANPSNVQHILKTRFDNYPKGDIFRYCLDDFLGKGIFNADGDTWKFQRQVASHEFNTKSLRKFVEQVVDTEVNDRLIPLLTHAKDNGKVIDLQDVLQRFAFDNICKIAFGYDPKCLTPSMPESEFGNAFEDCVRISATRMRNVFPISWKVKRFFNIGSERRLREAASLVREFAKKMVREKMEELKVKSSLDSVDLLSRFLTSGHSDEDFVTDIVISFILAGRDTTSAALTWFFWLLSSHPDVENEILTEINEKSDSPIYEEVKDMVYTHAALCESMRFYPPVPVDTKQAENDDVLPSGMVIKKGYRVIYHIYTMGRLESIWGPDVADYKPERWLQRIENEGDGKKKKWSFVGKDTYTYPVFQAGPRICLGKEMAFLQMKRVVAGVMKHFKVVPAFKEGDEEPLFVGHLSGKMKGGFPVRIEERGQ
ncbi:hypothetical protein ACFE04_031572 [Oxalis oulophora]